MFVEWRRGSRRRTGRTKIVDVINNEASWNEDIVIETKIETSGELDRNQTLEARNFQEKRISISVKEVRITFTCSFSSSSNFPIQRRVLSYPSL